MNLGVISIYPPPKEKHAKLGGVGSYTKNLVESLKERVDHLYIFSNKNKSSYQIHNQQNITVDYCWDEGSLKYPFQIFSHIFKKRKNIDVLHMQYEVFLYGGFFYAMFVPLLITFLRLLKKPLIITIHQIVPYSQINKDFLKILGVNGSPFLFKFGLSLLIKFIYIFSEGIIVHEDPFKDSLIHEYGCKNKQKIHVINHGVESSTHVIEKSKAKQKLKLPKKSVILFFGYLSNYKGLDILIDSMKHLKNQDFFLVIAGGQHPRLKEDPAYQSYVSGLHEKVKDFRQKVRFTGFVSEDEIGLYFSAADIIIFPYIIVMSSSGPMALALSYKKSFLASQSYQGIIDQKLLFKKSPKNLSEKINEYFNNEHLQKFIKKYIGEISRERSWIETGKKHMKIYQKME